MEALASTDVAKSEEQVERLRAERNRLLAERAGIEVMVTEAVNDAAVARRAGEGDPKRADERVRQARERLAASETALEEVRLAERVLCRRIASERISDAENALGDATAQNREAALRLGEAVNAWTAASEARAESEQAEEAASRGLDEARRDAVLVESAIEKQHDDPLGIVAEARGREEWERRSKRVAAAFKGELEEGELDERERADLAHTRAQAAEHERRLREIQTEAGTMPRRIDPGADEDAAVRQGHPYKRLDVF